MIYRYTITYNFQYIAIVCRYVVILFRYIVICQYIAIKTVEIHFPDSVQWVQFAITLYVCRIMRNYAFNRFKICEV